MNPKQSKQPAVRSFLKRNYKKYYAQNNMGEWEEAERLACPMTRQRRLPENTRSDGTAILSPTTSFGSAATKRVNGFTTR